MVDRTSETTIELRLQQFLSAELSRAEADFPHLRVPTSTPRRAAAPLGLVVIAAVFVATVALVRPLSSVPPSAPGGDPLGPDGIPLSIDGEPVLRGGDIDSRLGTPGSFLAGGYLVLHSATCGSESAAAGTGCQEDWRLDEQPGDHSVPLNTVGGAALVRTSGAASVLRLRTASDEIRGGLGTSSRLQRLRIEAVAWRRPTKGSIPVEASPPGGGELNMALVPDFVGALGGPTGETIVGYVPKELLLGPRPPLVGTPQNPPQELPLPVYGEDLTTLVGHMVPGQGFVPLGASPALSGIDGSPSFGPSVQPAVVWGTRVPGPAPEAVANRPVVARGESSITLLPISPSGAVIGVAYGYDMPHCGISSPIDVDGSFWDAVGVPPNSFEVGVPPNSVDFDGQAGTFRLTSHITAEFRRRDGAVLQLVRHDGPKEFLICS
jgi:hypothetical protein